MQTSLVLEVLMNFFPTRYVFSVIALTQDVTTLKTTNSGRAANEICDFTSYVYK